MPMEKTFDAAQAEARISAMWEAAGAFRAGANASRDDTFCVMIPPPNVTGSLHVGHAFNNTLQDILVRWHRMRGFDTLWQPGQDHAGIATQLVVERKLAAAGNMGRREMGRAAFLDKVWEWKAESGNTIIDQLKRLGASCDWSRNAFTMSGAPGAPAGEAGNFHDAVIRVFVDMYHKGLIYRGKRLVNWDPHFETAISDLEVENLEVAGHMWHFKYPLAGGATYRYVEKDQDGRVLVDEERDYIAIATTRPETMLGDGAVAVHPSDERYAPIVGMLCEIPVGPKEHRRLIPIITDDYPDPTFGSGAVKITGAHDFNDYAVAKRAGIPCYRLMDSRAHLRDDGAPYAECAALAQKIIEGAQMSEAEIDAINLVPDDYRGLDRLDARARVVAAITAEGLAVTKLVKSIDPETGAEHLERVPYVEDKPIMQPFGDRSKVVIEPMLTDQWFVDTAQIVGPALDAVRDGRTTIMPESGEKTYFHWLENIEPWCISRQLWWGHQIPVWYGLDIGAALSAGPGGDLDEVDLGALLLDGAVRAGEVHRCAPDLARIAATFRSEIADMPQPLNAAQVIEVADKHEAIQALAASLAQYATTGDPTHLAYPVWRDPDVLDTWFSSGLWPIGTLGWPDPTPELRKYFPTDVLITGQDILFFWVARMMMMQLAVVGEVPFHTVYLHQLVRDEKGKKMSKTTGNVIDPLDIIDQYGADALRFTNAAMAALGGVLKLSEDRIKGYRNFGTKLWNAHRFAEMNGAWEGLPAERATDRTAIPAATQPVNLWIIGETARTLQEVDAALAAYRFNEAASALYAFVWGKVCDWYVEFSKPLLQGEDTTHKAETQQVMAWVLDQCLILLHPIMPFITEELWTASGPRAKLLAHAAWPGYTTALADPAADAEMSWVLSLIEGIRSARAQMNVPVGLYLPVVMLDADAAARGAFARNAALIQRLARIEAPTEALTAPKGALTIPTQGATFALPLAGIIDVAGEKTRLTKAREKLGKEIAGLRGRLNNPNFATSAPPEVVEEAQANLALREDEAAQLDTALARLAEMA
ncbi:MAG: valine--tRNA ligase [Rhodobacterales bacterium]|nr:valine--tRNA ligase [Rhodobacterales bacterium]NCT11956.1 valine--tRNA ligase [Rhodobacterales bacterium]